MNAEKGNDWCMRVVDRMDRYYSKFFGELGDAIEEHYLKDGWQFLATVESMKAITATLHWPKPGLTFARAKFVGGLLGHTVAHNQAMCDPKLWGYICTTLNNLADILPGCLGDFEPLAADENPFIEALPQFNSAVATAMRYPSRQSKDEQIQFFEGYTKALRFGSLTMNARGTGETLRTQAYQLIAIFSPILSRHCKSVHDVHRFLLRMMGRQRAGDIKRTEGICKKIGLRFRTAGRPSRIQKPGLGPPQV